MLITISRQYSTNGVLIARRVAEQLRIPIYERELLTEMARLLHLNPVAIDTFFEHPPNPVMAVLTEWQTSLSPEMYIRYLRKAVNSICQHGDAVLVGRGANFVTPSACNLHVRIIAPVELRAAIFHVGNDLPMPEIERIIQKRDLERSQYIRNVFHQNIDDPHHYDLVLNLRCVSPERAVEHIVAEALARKAQTPTPGAHPTMPEHLRMMIKARHHVRAEIVEREMAGRK